MLRSLVVVLILLFSVASQAQEWVSPIDKKYMARNLELFEKYDQARDLLNLWRGEREILEKASALLSEVLEADREFAPAIREFARVFMMGGGGPTEKAILRSIELEPDYADSYVLLGYYYTMVGRYTEATEALGKAGEIGTENPWLNINWAIYYRKHYRYDDAMRKYERVLKKGTSNPKAYAATLSGITDIHEARRQFDKANISYQKQIENGPQDPTVWRDYAFFLLFSNKDVDGAIEKARKAFELRDYKWSRIILACALYTKWAMTKDDPASVKNAQAYFDEAVSILPPDSEEVLVRTDRNPYTQITAKSLREL